MVNLITQRVRQWLWPILPVLRTIRHRSEAKQLRSFTNRLVPSRNDGPRVCYLTRRFPERPATHDEYTFGGAVKMSYLAEAFPHSYPEANILYAVSSVFHPLMPKVAADARRRGLKIVLNQNGVAYPGWHGAGWQDTNQIMRALLQTADYVIYQSKFCRIGADRFLGAPPVGCWEIIYNPVDTENFYPLSPDFESRHLVLLLGGNQRHRYRFETAVRALAIAVHERPNIRLLVTGELWLTNQAKAVSEARLLTDSLGVTDKVELVGTYSQHQAPALMQRAHILLHTQYNDACPTLVLEAMACGLPVVYSASGGTPELVGDEAGIGIPTALSWEHRLPPDPKQLAEAILRVADQRKIFAEAARQRAVDKFSLPQYISQHKKLFENLVNT